MERAVQLSGQHPPSLLRRLSGSQNGTTVLWASSQPDLSGQELGRASGSRPHPVAECGVGRPNYDQPPMTSSPTFIWTPLFFLERCHGSTLSILNVIINRHSELLSTPTRLLPAFHTSAHRQHSSLNPELIFKSWASLRGNFCVTSSLKPSRTAFLAGVTLFRLMWPGVTGHLLVCGHATVRCLKDAPALIRCVWNF